MSSEKIDLRIGEILVEAGILEEQDLAESVKTARSTGLPVGRVLIMGGFMSETEFQAALQAQSLIRDGIVSLETAVQALALISDSQLTFDEALSKVGWQASADKDSNKLGELLLQAQIVPKEQLDTAMRTSRATGLPLGQLLVSLGCLSDGVLATALNAQSLIRAGRIMRDQGVRGLRAAFNRRSPMEKMLIEQGYYRGQNRQPLRLGELLKSANLLTEEELSRSLEKELVEEKSLGEVLVANNHLDSVTLNAALHLQEMVANETLDSPNAAECLSKLHQSKKPLSEVVALQTIPDQEIKAKVRYHELLRVAGLIGQTEIDSIAKELADNSNPSFADAHVIAKTLFAQNIIDERTYYGSLRCYFLLATGWLNMQQGIIALNYFHHRECTFDEALHELKWTMRTHVNDTVPLTTSL